MNKKVKDKIVKPSIKPIEPPKIAYDQYFDYIDFREKPASENFIMRLGQEFVDWCFNSNGHKASQFFLGKGIDSRTYYRWYDKHPKFAHSYDYGLQVLGNKRETLMLEGKYKEKPVMHRMHAYDPEWKSSDKYHSELKLEDDNAEKKYILVDRILAEKKDE